MPECPICKKEFEVHGSNSYLAHMQTKHSLYWAEARRLRRIATVNLMISLAFTILLLTFFYSPDELGFATMGLAALFLAISSVFSLRERGLGKRCRNKTGEKEPEEATRKRAKSDQKKVSKR